MTGNNTQLKAVLQAAIESNVLDGRDRSPIYKESLNRANLLIRVLKGYPCPGNGNGWSTNDLISQLRHHSWWSQVKPGSLRTYLRVLGDLGVINRVPYTYGLLYQFRDA
jgi:hypothetical protein